MVSGKHKSRTLRRVYVRIPSGNSKLHYRKRNMSKVKCGNCRKELHGIPRGKKSKFKNLSKTQKRPERPYGGVLCSACTRKKLKEKAAGIIKK